MVSSVNEIFLQRSELTCKQYKKWLHALVGYAQAAMTGREGVKAAQAECGQREEELDLFLKECHEFLGSQKKPKRKHSDRCRLWYHFKLLYLSLRVRVASKSPNCHFNDIEPSKFSLMTTFEKNFYLS